jgi:hypothetical protein
MYEIVRDGRQRGEAVCQRPENGVWHERLVLHVTRGYAAANWRERSFCGLQPAGIEVRPGRDAENHAARAPAAIWFIGFGVEWPL